MKRELSPAVVVGIIAVVAIIVAVFGYRTLKPAGYTPSPGVSSAGGPASGAPGMTGRPGQPGQPAGSVYYPVAPPGSIPGKPPGK
jgi:hypothetical protein